MARHDEYMAGSYIPIVVMSRFRKEKLNYVVTITWNSTEIMQRLGQPRNLVGRFVTTFPQLVVV